MAVSKRLRYEIPRRDNHTCRCCGESAPDVKLTVDHVVPVSLGGSDDPTNLVAACPDCNAGKSSSGPDAPLVADVDDDAIRWARAIVMAAEVHWQQDADDRAFSQQFFDQMTDMFVHDRKLKVPNLEAHGGTSGARQSLLTFRSQGLELWDLTDAIRAAMSNPRLSRDDVWRYFCGICWRRIDERRKIARSLIDEGAV